MMDPTNSGIGQFAEFRNIKHINSTLTANHNFSKSLINHDNHNATKFIAYAYKKDLITLQSKICCKTLFSVSAPFKKWNKIINFVTVANNAWKRNNLRTKLFCPVSWSKMKKQNG